jgi:hypothetical protein
VPKVHFVQKAAKDHPEIGVAKGESYYHWSFRYGGMHKSKTKPRPSQLTQSKLSSVYAANEALEDAVDACDNPGDLPDALRECADEVRSVADEYSDAAEAMGAAGEQHTDSADQLNDYADELESAADEIEGLNASDYVDADARRSLIEEEMELELEGEQTLDQDKVDARVSEVVEAVKEFDDLEDEEKEEMLTAAKEIASSVDCPL